MSRAFAILPGLALAALATGARAENEAPLGQPIDLETAVLSSVASHPAVRSVMTDVDERRGILDQQSGRFDGTFFVDAQMTFVQRDMVRDEISNEIKRRVPAEFAAIGTPDDPTRGALDQAADLLEASTPYASNFLVDDCGDFDTRLLVDLGTPGTVSLCLDSTGNLRGVAIDSLAVSAQDLAELAGVLQILDVIGQGFEDDARESIRQLLTQTASLLRQTAEAFRIQRARLGDLPEEEELTDARLEVGHRWQLRSGLGITASLVLAGTQDDFDGKAHDPNFGDSVIPNTYSVDANLRFLVPLGKGRGRVATAGPEHAAEVALRAQTELAIHTASEQAFDAARQYWTTAAALERWKLLAGSVATQERILAATEELIRAGELPGAERSRVEARLADARRELASAAGELVEAQGALAQAMGVSIDRLDLAPLPTAALPDGPTYAVSPLDWMEIARGTRHDLAAAAAARDAGAILAETAKANLRHQVDFAFNLAYGGAHDSFNDRIYDLGAYWEAASGKIVGPSYAVGLRWALPVGNRTARGRLLQAEASVTRSDITAQNLERQIRLQLFQLAGSLEHQQAEKASRERLLQALEKTLESSLERYRIGDLPLIDVLTTERQLTDARLGLVDVRRDLAILEAQIRFESGTFLAEPAGGSGGDPTRLLLDYRPGEAPRRAGP